MTPQGRPAGLFQYTMWIQTDSNTKRLKSEHTDGEFVEFNDSGSAQVSAEVGEALIENYSEITEK